jgi:hypothetical protein
MRPYYWRFIAGLVLLLFGAIALMQNFNVINVGSNIWGLLMAVIFIGAGASFLTVLFTNRLNWWAAIPGVILLALGIMIAVPILIPAFSGSLLGAFFLAAIGLSFWVVYFLSPQNWWAIIPGGALFTLAAIAGLSDYGGIESGSLLFLGLAITFALVGLIPVGGRHMTWPWIPAGVLFVFGALLSFNSYAWGRYLWPVLLILVGLVIIVRPRLRRG